MRSFRKYMLELFSGQSSEDLVPERVFLARRSGDIRTPNGEALIKIAKEYGFQVINPEQKSFATQIKIFQSAKLVIGPGGAAFSNTIFCSPGARIVLWKPSAVPAENMFENLALISGADIETVHLSDLSPGEAPHQPWFFPTIEFRKLLERETRQTMRTREA